MRLADPLLLSWLLLLAGCASTAPEPAPVDALSRFDVLMPFLPERMQSYWFSDGRDLEWNRLEPDVLRVWAARDFEAPHERNVGAHAFVEVSYRGPDAPPVTIDDGHDVAAEPIDGVPTWRTPGAFGRQEDVLALVAGGITVRASSRELLVAALRRTGSREAVLRSLPSPAALRERAREFLLLLPRPQPDQVPHARPELLCGGPSPRTPLFAEACFDGEGYTEFRLIGAAQQPLADFARAWSAFTHLPAGEVHGHGGVFAIDFEVREPDGLLLCLYLLFGLHMLI